MLVIIAIIVGISLTYYTILIINQFVYDFLHIFNEINTIVPNALRETAYIIGLVVFLVVLMFSGYTYRNTILQLLNTEKECKLVKYKNLVYIYILGFVMIFTSNNRPGSYFLVTIVNSIALVIFLNVHVKFL